MMKKVTKKSSAIILQSWAIAGLSAVTIQAGPELRLRPALLSNFRFTVLLRIK
jgi:hypothetical protein